MALSSTPGLRHHWRAARASSNGTTVLALADTGPASATLSAGAGSPLYRPDGFATSRPAIEYPAPTGDGPCFWQGSAALAGLSALTIGAVATVRTGAVLASTLLSRELGIKVDLTADQKPRLLVSNNGTSWAINATAASAVSLGVPHTYVVVIGGGSASLRVDGVQVVTGTFTGAIGSNTSDFAVGAVNRNGSVAWRGLIGDVLVSDQALSGANLTALEADLLASATPAPIATSSGPTILPRENGTWPRRKLNLRTAGAWVWGA